MNKKGFNWACVLLIVGVMFLIGLAGILLSEYYSIISNNCLKEIAEEYCHDKGLIYSEIFWSSNYPYFECKEDERSMDGIPFNFLDSELKECKGKE